MSSQPDRCEVNPPSCCAKEPQAPPGSPCGVAVPGCQLLLADSQLQNSAVRPAAVWQHDKRAATIATSSEYAAVILLCGQTHLTVDALCSMALSLLFVMGSSILLYLKVSVNRSKYSTVHVCNCNAAPLVHRGASLRLPA